jgi:hypothetical protein
MEEVVARKVFFSFHYGRDISRANVVRNSWLTKDKGTAGFIDASLWEEAKAKGDAAIKKLIDDQMIGTTVTAVLIGSETAQRTYVKYEIAKSLERGNGLLGIYIHNIKDLNGNTASKGTNPLADGFPTYDWVVGNGYANLGTWVEAAYKAAS